MRAVVLVGIVSGDDVGMSQLGGRLDLAVKALDEIGILDLIGGEDLKSDFALHRLVLGQKDLPHPSGPDAVFQDVAIDFEASFPSLGR